MKKIICFTDGSCVNNGKENAKASFCYKIYEECINFFCEIDEYANLVPKHEKQSNNTGELYAIKELLEFLLKMKLNEDEIILYTDSEYCINSLTKWYISWSKDNWKKEIKNKELIKNILKTKEKFNNLIFIYVKAHTNLHKQTSLNDLERFIYENNDIVDNLAKKQLKI
jgi:ribonuclease HI